MSIYIRNLGTRISKTINGFGKDMGTFSYFKLSVVKRNWISVRSQFSVNTNHMCYRHYITSRGFVHNDKDWSSLNSRMLFVSVGIFNLFGLKKDDPTEEPELITTIKRGILLTQVWISVLLRIDVRFHTGAD
jgi:hypothetical protein